MANPSSGPWTSGTARRLTGGLTLALSLALSLGACSKAPEGKPNQRDSDPKSLVPAEAGAAANNPHAKSRAAPGAQRVRDANPQLAPTKAPPPSAPKSVNFDGKTRRDIVDDLGYTVPSQWATQTPTNRMRLAQYDLPGEGGGASLVLYRFPGGGGSAQQNIDRWVTQFKQADGSPTIERLIVKEIKADPYAVTTVELSGTYEAAPMGPGAKAKGPAADTRMLAAIVEGDGNPFFFKIIGPAKTVSAWEQAFNDLVASFKKGE